MVINVLKIIEGEVGNLVRDLKSMKGNCRTKHIIQNKNLIDVFNCRLTPLKKGFVSRKARRLKHRKQKNKKHKKANSSIDQLEQQTENHSTASQ